MKNKNLSSYISIRTHQIDRKLVTNVFLVKNQSNLFIIINAMRLLCMQMRGCPKTGHPYHKRNV